MSARPRIEIQIDELVLDGFPQADRHAIAESLSLELERLVATQGIDRLAGLRDVPDIRAAGIHLAAGAGPRSIGAQAARSVHASLGSRDQERAK